MKKKNYDITVAYRIYPEISKSPAIFSKDKDKLAEFCLKSFKNSLGSLKAKIFAILDKCPQEYEELFKFAAKVGALEGYLYEREKVEPLYDKLYECLLLSL